MRRGTPILIIFIVLVLLVIGVSQFFRAQPPLEITVAVNPLAQAWVSSAVTSYNATEPLVSGTRRVHVTVSTIDDLSAWSDAGQNNWRETHPTAWIPASSASIGYANRLPLDTVVPSLAQTMLVWGGFSDRVSVLTDGGAHPLDWDDVVRAAQAGRWANLPGGEALAGNVNLAFSRPDSSATGLAVILSGAADFSDTAAVSGTTVVSDEFHDWAQPLLESVPNYATLGASVARSLAGRGTSVGDIALLPESEWLTNLSGELVSDNPITLSYPAYAFVFDFPLARWQGLSADENAAVEALGAYLLAQHPETFGLRPASGIPPLTGQLFTSAQSYGVLLAPDVSQTVQPPPRPEVQRLLAWLGQVVR
jgi:hypothetical protein